MATMPNTNINIPYSAFLDPTTGRPSQAWLLWLMSPTFININIGSALPVTSGGTGLTTIPTNGQLLIGNGTGYTLNTLGFGAGISVTNGSGTITVANTGVLSNIAGSGISVSNPTGNVTIGNTGVLSIIAGSGISASSPTGNVTVANTGVLSFSGGTTGLTPATATTGAITLAGTLAIASGGTNGTATPTAYGVAYGTGTAYTFTAAGTAKQVLIANTSAAPTWSTLTSGTSILYGDGTGGFSNVTIGSGVSFVAGTLSATGSGGTVTSVTGTSPVVSSGGTTPAISLATAYGDTLNPYASKTANYFLGAPNGSAGVPTFRALTTADIPALSYVTSVALALPSIMTVSGSPVTGSGTLTGTLTTQAVNSIFAGPSSGSAAAPTFRALTTADIPALPYGTGTVTSVAALTLGTTGTDLSSTVANSTTTPVITLNVPTASASNRGALSSTDWTTFNNKGSVTSVSFTGGLITVATATTTPALTVAGTSGGIVYFSSASTWASSAALTQYGVVYGGGAGASPVSTAAGTTGQVLTATTGGAPTWANPATSGTVTSVSVVSANGFAGTVATSTTTPAITISTSITGVLKGNGTAILAAVANTDYVPLSTVITKTADYTITGTDTWIINNKPSTALTLTFPAASNWTGRYITVKNMQALAVNSASSNIVPIDSTTAGTAILLGVVGNWATLVSDGTNWVIMQAASNNNLLLE